jgi:hypothetical protein
MTKKIITILLFIIINVTSLSSCSHAASKANLANPSSTSMMSQMLSPNLDERKAYYDIIYDEYPNRYPQINDFKEVKMVDYLVSLPKGWYLDDGVFPKIYNDKNQIVGEIFTQSFDLNYISILPDNTELLDSQDIDINGLSALSLIYSSQPPAASGSDRITIKQSICFIDKVKKEACYLTFDKAYFENNSVHYEMLSNTIIQIAKTFSIKIN